MRKSLDRAIRKSLSPEDAKEVIYLLEQGEYDKALLDFLEHCNKQKIYTGRCAFGWSHEGRGWRLLETKGMFGSYKVRDAIKQGMKREGWKL